MSKTRLRPRRSAALLAAVVLTAAGCTRYEQKPLPIRLPSTYANAVEAFGVTLAADAYQDPQRAKSAFGFDILGAGVLPVQLIFDHQGSDEIQIVPNQTFLVDTEGQLWNILDQNLAYQRIQDKTEWGEIAPGSAKGGLLGATAGALVGAAIGIVTGTSIGEAAGKGAAVGGAGGAVFGGGKGMQDPTVRRSIRDDLRNRTLENKPIPPASLSHGVLYFPVEATDPRQLRVQVKNMASGEVRSLTLGLEP